MLGKEDIPQEAQAKEPPKKGASVFPTMETSELQKLWVGRAFGMETQSEMKKYGDRIEKIVKWAYAKGITDPKDIFVELRHLRNTIGGRPTIHDIIVKIGLEDERTSLLKKTIAIEDKIKKLSYGKPE